VIPTAQARTYIPPSARDDKWVWSPLYLKKGGGLLIICEFQWFRTGVEARALHWLLVSQCFHGLDSGGAVGWDHAREEAHCNQQDGHRSEGYGIGGFYTVDEIR